ncbi:hypothetical protein SAMN02745823_01175 [Sporobacter termitidis DSM 10068]|uniref:Subtilase family protein n=1 Tax=Sporobacter termitidis DSM 10068 TaxID=1123282 RepID=A0A1M5WBP8_9FIRM|nr:hypothetical protein [Sporobacter termitidis]SHH84848.1 hypothetical protein SAMN02745823_01175 [Sporobacter termitidis DSM 10068]
MSRIAIIDTAIDCAYINGKAVEYINLCGENKPCIHREISHGTLCALVLDYCASDYELVNIQIFKDNKGKVFGEIELLANSLKLCRELKIDIISLSAVSSVLSDSKHLYNNILRLSADTVVVSALDNKQYVCIPTSYPEVLGVRNDAAGLLSPGEIAYSADDPFGANIYANCDFKCLRKQHCRPSNSFAVPVVTAYVNKLINKGQSISDIKFMLQNLKPYPLGQEHKELNYPVARIAREIPIVFLADDVTEMCGTLMDRFYEKYEVQSTALSLTEGIYDIRIKNVKSIDTITDDLHFMEHHYKTDLIFIVGREKLLEKIQQHIDIDVEITCQSDGRALICYENNQEIEINSKVADRLHEILTS